MIGLCVIIDSLLISNELETSKLTYSKGRRISNCHQQSNVFKIRPYLTPNEPSISFPRKNIHSDRAKFRTFFSKGYVACCAIV